MEQNKEFRNRPTQAYPGIFKKAAKTIQWRKKNFFIKWFWSHLVSKDKQNKTQQNTNKKTQQKQKHNP